MRKIIQIIPAKDKSVAQAFALCDDGTMFELSLIGEAITNQWDYLWEKIPAIPQPLPMKRKTNTQK